MRLNSEVLGGGLGTPRVKRREHKDHCHLKSASIEAHIFRGAAMDPPILRGNGGTLPKRVFTYPHGPLTIDISAP